MKEETPYRSAQKQKKPYANIKIDYRTAGDTKDGLCLHLWGPVSPKLAAKIEKLILEIGRSKA